MYLKTDNIDTLANIIHTREIKWRYMRVMLMLICDTKLTDVFEIPKVGKAMIEDLKSINCYTSDIREILKQHNDEFTSDYYSETELSILKYLKDATDTTSSEKPDPDRDIKNQDKGFF